MFRLFLAACLFAVLATACEAMPVPTTVPPTPIPTRTPTVTPSPVPSPTPVVPPIVKSGAVVIGSTPMTAKHFIPLWLNSQPQFLAMPLTLPALTWFDDKAQPIPDLASKIDINADATVITFTLPIKATWSDGTPLTTKDVAFTYKLALDPALNSSLWGINFSSIKGAGEFQKNTAKDVDGIKIIDAQTIRFELKESNAAFLFNTYLGILPAHLLGTMNPRDIEQQAYIDWPNVTSGPYEVLLIDAQSILLRKKANYWGKSVNIDAISIRFLTNPQSVAPLLRSGQVLVTSISPDQIADLRALPNVNTVSTKGIGYQALHIDARTKEQIATLTKPREQGGAGYSIPKVPKPYLRDKRFRQALNFAFDRRAIIQSIARGEGAPISSPIFAPEWAINSGMVNYDVDVEKAKTLMKAAGATFDATGNALWQNAPITLVYLASAGDESRRLGELTQQQLAKIGIRTEIKLVPAETFLQAAIAGDGDLIRNVGGRWGADPSVSAQFYACKAGWAELVMGFCSFELDEMESKGLKFSSLDERKKIYAQVSSLLNDQAPSVFLFSPNSVFAVNKGLLGVKPNADPNFLTFNIQDWAFQK